MTHHLTADQSARLTVALQQREAFLRARLKAQYGDASRVQHAREVLLQDGDDAPQRDADREVDLAMSDRDTVELTQIEQAMGRLVQGSFGRCVDCGKAVPFQRLTLEPHTQRCVGCESVFERHQPSTASL